LDGTWGKKVGVEAGDQFEKNGRVGTEVAMVAYVIEDGRCQCICGDWVSGLLEADSVSVFHGNLYNFDD
jgi:hypothetical protein